jgi:hypothetical protein
MSTLRPEAAHRGHNTQEGWRLCGSLLACEREERSAVHTKSERDPQDMWGRGVR